MKADRNWEYLTGSSCAAFWLTTQAQFAYYDVLVLFTWKFKIMHLDILRLLRTTCQEIRDKQRIFIFIYFFSGNIRKKETQYSQHCWSLKSDDYLFFPWISHADYHPNVISIITSQIQKVIKWTALPFIEFYWLVQNAVELFQTHDDTVSNLTKLQFRTDHIQHMSNCSFLVQIYFLPPSLTVMPVSACLRKTIQGNLRNTAFCCCISFLAVYNLSQGDCVRLLIEKRLLCFSHEDFNRLTAQMTKSSACNV